MQHREQISNQSRNAYHPSAQTQDKQPGDEYKMQPKPIAIHPDYRSANKLQNKVALITGGDSGIGRAVVYHFAAEGAKIAYVYLNEEKDATEVNQYLEEKGVEYLAIAGDISDKDFCQSVVDQTMDAFGQINCVVNNAAQQFPVEKLEDITPDQLEKTFKLNIFGYFYLTQCALPHMHKGDTIINTTSVTAYRGSKQLIDYAATKGAIVSFTRSLSQALTERDIRVNAVAPGPVWTPLIPASFGEEKVENFGSKSPMGIPAQPADVAPAYVYLASSDSALMSGQVLHVNSGEIVNG